jgi:hypothetical protein
MLTYMYLPQRVSWAANASSEELNKVLFIPHAVILLVSLTDVHSNHIFFT